MKKVLLITIMASFVSLVIAQKSVTFKMKYLPNHNYDMAMNMAMNFKVNLSGNDDIISKLESQGITQPLNADVKMDMGGNTKTGNAAADGTFPMTMNIKLNNVSVQLSGKDIPIPTDKIKTNTTIYGHSDVNGKLKADSVTGSVKDTASKKIAQLMNSIQNKIKFPDHPLKVGDTFTQDLPLNIPMSQSSDSEAAVKAVYKLVSIANGNAVFEVTQTVDMKLNIQQATLTIAGTGAGTVTYSIKNSFPTDYKSKLDLKIDGQFSSLVIKGTATMDASYTYVIN